MRFYVYSICLAFLLATTATGAPLNSGAQPPKPQFKLDDAPALFEKFIKDYNKQYKNAEDKEVHYQAFVESLRQINRLNSDSKKSSATYGINQLSDYTEEERKKMFGNRFK